MKIKLKLIQWTPRVICILTIFFISIFALDAFNPEKTIWQQISGFFIHLIPSFVLAFFLIIAWKHEFIGGLLFILVGFIFSTFIFTHNYNMNQSVWMSLLIILITTMPFLISGILFMVSHTMKKKNLSSSIKN
jgi:hypothetical protein